MGKQIKAVFFDIDGTFYDHKTNQIIPSSIEACKMLQQNGIKVVLCSGRPKAMADDLHVFDYLDWDGYIGNSGGCVYDDKFNVIYQDFYTKEQVTKIFEIAEKNDVVLFSFGEHEFVWNRYNSAVEGIIDYFHVKKPPIRRWNNEDLSCLTIMEEDGASLHLFEEVEGVFMQRVTPYNFEIYKDNVHKAIGIQQLMNHWGFEENAFVGFGDSDNDVEMLTLAEIGVTMGNGTDKAKEAADIICGASDSNGIYDTLKNLKLI